MHFRSANLWRARGSLTLVRLLSAFALALLPIASLAEWHINAKHSLIWNGAPYLPIGVRVAGTPEAITKVNEAEIKDVIVELPAPGETWNASFAALDKAGIGSMVPTIALAAAPEGYIIEPQGYRISQITETRTEETNIAGAKSDLGVLHACECSVVH